MKTININKDSWHYWFAEKADETASLKWDAQSICSYTRLVLKGILFTLLLTLAVGFLLGGVVDFLIAIGCMIYYGKLIPLDYFGCIGALIVVCLSFGGISRARYVWRNSRKVDSSSPGFISSAWKAFKEKTCMKVEFV